MYDPRMVQPMRDEVTRLGVTELRTPEAVDAALKEAPKGTTLVFVNSVCGCAAGNARPALRLLLEKGPKPDRSFTVFAGQDREATDQARSYFTGMPPSSPCFALLRDGKVAAMLHRHDIEGRMAPEIAKDLAAAVAGGAPAR
jgi:putative YphP/YqiW family bacilliredoxin